AGLGWELAEPFWRRARGGDGHPVPAVRSQGSRGGAADQAGAADQHRPRHYSSPSSTCPTLCRAAKAATTAAARTMPPAIWSARWTPWPAESSAATSTFATTEPLPFAIG